jgi:hypothetical protein
VSGGCRRGSRPVLEAGGGPEELLDTDQGHNEEATTAQSPRRSLPPKGSEPSSSCQCSAVGRNRARFGVP